MTEATRSRQRHSRRPLRVAREHRRTYDPGRHSHRDDARGGVGDETRDDARVDVGDDARAGADAAVGAAVRGDPCGEAVGDQPAGGQDGGEDGGGDRRACHAALRGGVEALTGLDLDPLDETAIRAELAVVQQAIRQLTAFRARAAGVLEQRALRTAGPGREQQALGTSRRRLANDLRLTPHRPNATGRPAVASPTTRPHRTRCVPATCQQTTPAS